MPLLLNLLVMAHQTGNLSFWMVSSKNENGISIKAYMGATTGQSISLNFFFKSGGHAE